MFNNHFIKSIIAISAKENIRMRWVTTAARAMQVAKLKHDSARLIDSLTKERAKLVT